MPLVLGIGAYSHFTTFREDVMLIAAGITAAVYIVSAIRKQQGGYATVLAFVTFNITLILAGWLFCYYHDIRNEDGWIGNDKTQEASVVMITSIPVEKARSWKIEVEITHSIQLNKVYPARGKAFVYISKYDAPAYKEGDVLIVPARWEEIRNNGNPYEFDYAGYLNRNNTYHQQFVKAADVHMYTYAEEEDLPFIRKVHYWCVAQLERYTGCQYAWPVESHAGR
jgi:competence protein ComEC